MGYDIFLSFKHHDDNGNITQDFSIAQELYNSLTQLGYKVFFSISSLEEIGSSRYKAAIDEALDDVKVLVVVLCSEDNATSKWVQYEWDSYYNDFLSGVRNEANLFTFTKDVIVQKLPRTLRNVQNFDYNEGMDNFFHYMKNICKPSNPVIGATTERERKIEIITGKKVTQNDISEAIELDKIVYDIKYHIDTKQCMEWFNVNPDIYVMAKDLTTNKVIAYTNISPVSEDCYNAIKAGNFIDTGITADAILSYDMPFPYSVYFSSIVIHPDYQNTEVFMLLFNAIVDKFIYLGKHEVFVKRMIADAVSKNGEKFCKLFGMTKIASSNHESTLYEITMIPPKFRIISKKTKILYDYYQQKYNDNPYLFEEDE